MDPDFLGRPSLSVNIVSVTANWDALINVDFLVVEFQETEGSTAGGGYSRKCVNERANSGGAWMYEC